MHKLNKKILLFFFIINTLHSNVTAMEDHRRIKKSLVFKKNEHPFLISFPASGNTYMRFLIEYMIEIPTSVSRSLFNNYFPRNNPISSWLDFEIDYTKCPILKRHDFEDYDQLKGPDRGGLTNKQVKLLNSDSTIIFIIRNPIRFIGKLDKYIELVKSFDEFSGEKLLLFYENIVNNPIEEVRTVARFLNLPINEERVNSYMEDKETFDRRLRTKNQDKPKGLKTTTFYKKKLNEILNRSQLTFEEVQEILYEKDAQLFDKYFSRYTEESF